MVPVGDKAKRCCYPSHEEQSEEKTTITLRPFCGLVVSSSDPLSLINIINLQLSNRYPSIDLCGPYWWPLLLCVMQIRPDFSKVKSWGISLNFVLSFLLFATHLHKICISKAENRHFSEHCLGLEKFLKEGGLFGRSGLADQSRDAGNRSGLYAVVSSMTSEEKTLFLWNLGIGLALNGCSRKQNANKVQV